MPNAKSTPTIVIILTFVAIALPFYVSEVLGESAFHELRWLRLLSREFWYQKFGPGGPAQTRIDEFKIVAIDRALAYQMDGRPATIQEFRDMLLYGRGLDSARVSPTSGTGGLY